MFVSYHISVEFSPIPPNINVTARITEGINRLAAYVFTDTGVFLFFSAKQRSLTEIIDRDRSGSLVDSGEFPVCFSIEETE